MTELAYKKISLKKNAVLNSLRAVLGLIFPLITFPYSSRVLGPEAIGKVQFANSIVTYFSMLAALGIQTYGIREAAKVRTDKLELSKFVREIFSINITSTIIAYILLAVALLFVPKFSSYRFLIIICSSSILFSTLGIEWLYNALEKFSYITIRSLFFQFLSFILLFALVRSREDVIQYASISVVASVGSNFLNFIHARKYIDFHVKIKKEYKKHFKPICILFLSSIATCIYAVLDTTILGVLTNNTQIGFYSAGTKINRIVISVLTSSIGILLPRLSSYIAEHDDNGFRILTRKAFQLIIMLALPSAIGLSIIAKPVILVLSGSEYEPAISVMRSINPTIIAISLSSLFGVQILLPLGKEKITFIAVILGAITNLSLNLILIPLYGALGAGIATSVAESSITLFQFFFINKYINWKEISPHLIQCLLATTLMGLCVYFFVKLNMNFLIQLILAILIGIVIYIAFLLFVRNKFLLEILHKEVQK